MKLPLTEQQFRDALAKGLGRAKMHIDQFGDDGLAGAILDACLTCGVHDPQSEGTRGAWLHDIIELTGQADRYRGPILDAFLAATPEMVTKYSVMQLATLVCNFAEAGNADARQAIFDRFASRHAEWGAIGADEIAYLDGLEGLAFVAAAIGGEDWCLEYAIWQAGETFGEAAVEAFLAERAKSDGGIRGFLTARAERKAATRARQGERATIFGPPRVLRKRQPLTPIGAFAANFAPGDGARIAQFLPTSGDDYALHDAALDIIDVSRAAKAAELAPALLWVYEVNPCSVCREHAVEDMIELGLATPDLLEEGTRDSNDRLRELAGEALASDGT